MVKTDRRARGLMRKLRVTGDPHSHTNFGVLGFLLAGLPIFTGLVFSASSVSAADPTTAKNILTLYSYSDGASFGSGSLARSGNELENEK
jgi:hypothetical protein